MELYADILILKTSVQRELEEVEARGVPARFLDQLEDGGVLVDEWPVVCLLRITHGFRLFVSVPNIHLHDEHHRVALHGGAFSAALL